MMTSWERRGHGRKPNAIVRGIYRVADWCGDFGHLWDTAKQGAINTGLVIANAIILVGILITSAVHSVQLLRHAGATGGLEYVLLIVWESVFLVSSFLLDQAMKRGMGSIKQSWQVWTPFLLGLIFVFASNLMGMADNMAGMLLGGITPFLLLFIKWMLGWQLHNRAEFDEAERAEKAKKATSNVQPIELVKSEKQPPEIEQENEQENEQTSKGIIKQNDLIPSLIEDEKEDKTGNTKKAETSQHSNEHETSNRAKKQAEKNRGSEEDESNKNQENEQPNEQTQTQKNKQKRVTKSSKKQTQNEEKVTDAELLRYAKKLRSKTGEIPKLKDLTAKANSKYQAEKIRKQLTTEAKPTLQLVKND